MIKWLTDDELLADLDWSTATDAEKLERAEREQDRVRRSGECTGVARETILARLATDEASRKRHEQSAFDHRKAHPGYCECRAREWAMVDLRKKLGKT